MRYNETHHAFLVFVFYKVLSEINGGKKLFIKAAQTYGEQRGLRMALRALRDGAELTVASYLAYGEWEPSHGAFDINFNAEDGVLNETVRRCPWADTWKKQNLPEAGIVYCQEIDGAILRGFNSALDVKIDSNISGNGICIFHFYDPAIKKTTLFKQAADIKSRHKEKVVEDFAYHCGHIWAVFYRAICDVFPDSAVKIMEQAAKIVCDEYGEKFLTTIRSHETLDFTRIGPKT
jgi:hypothetical protein